MDAHQTLHNKLTEALTEYCDAQQASPKGGPKGATKGGFKINPQLLISAIMQLIAAFTGGGAAPAPTIDPNA